MSVLTVSRVEAAKRLQDQTAKGEELLTKRIGSKGDLDDARDRYYTWTEYNEDLLKTLFTTADEADSYRAFHGMMILGGSTPLAQKIDNHFDDVRSKLRRLTSVLERLELADEPSVESSDEGAAPETDSQDAIAHRLIEILNAVKESNFADRNLIREAQALNARLAPTYLPIYGSVPLITTTYPTRVWFPRALNQAEQALAVASAGRVTPPPRPPEQPPSDRVFVVHGHDHGLKEAVARLIESFGYRAVILHEREDRGQTVIEKFERESPDAAFAVVLLTPDDEGRLRPLENEVSPDLVPRARQNVVWEFGYFTAVLGRSNVAALVFSDEELARPSDLDGLLYIPVRTIDDQNWRLKLAREMRAAGLDIDLNKVE